MGMVEGARTLTVSGAPEELYAFWREASTLWRLTAHLADGAALLENRDPLARPDAAIDTSWDADVAEEEPGRRLSWRTREGARPASEGTVAFRPAPPGWGTEVELRMRVEEPEGTGGPLEPDDLPSALAHTVLRRCKALVETAEIPNTQRNPSGRSGRDG